MKTVQKLVNGECKKLGSHRKEVTDFGQVHKYYYYATCICEVNHATREIIIDNGGYKTTSTTRAINSYLNELSYLNYDIVDLRR